MATNPPDLSLGVGARSEKGRREENQDKMTAFPTSLGTVYIVADGMGGHRGGAEASHMVIEGYRRHLTSFQEGAGLPDVLQAATVLTNAEILEAGHSGDPTVAGMGSTVVLAVLRNGAGGMEMMTGHIGDSRAYLLRAGALHRLTRDHSAVQRMVDAHIISAEAARSHPDSNVLTRALGQQPNITIDVSVPEQMLPGDTLLLCSDGLWGYVPDEQIRQELSLDRNASETADALAELALAQGSDDNITLQVLRLEDRQKAMRAPEALRQTQVDGILIANQQGKLAKMLLRSQRAVPPAGRSRKKVSLAVVLSLSAVLCLVAGALAWFFAQRSSPHANSVTSSQPVSKGKPAPQRPLSKPAPNNGERNEAERKAPRTVQHPSSPYTTPQPSQNPSRQPPLNPQPKPNQPPAKPPILIPVPGPSTDMGVDRKPPPAPSHGPEMRP